VPGQRDIPALFTRLVDDAAVFPPGNATVPDAVRLHLAGRDGEHAEVIGVFLCPASRLPELITELIKVKPTKPVELSLVIDTGMGGVPKALSIVESRSELLALRMVEMPAPSDVDEVWLERVSEFVPEDVIRVIEPRRGGPDWLAGIGKVIEHGSWPKLRCGGLSGENFPSIDEVTDFLSVVRDGDASFKATAGLHNAVRHTDAETGFTHHGFLNLLIATARLLAADPADELDPVRAALGSTDGAALAKEALELSEDAALAARGVFSSYGSCSLTDPVDDLEQLGLL